MKRLKSIEVDEQGDFTLDDVKAVLGDVSKEYECPEIMVAYEAVTAAMKAVEVHPDAGAMMGTLFDRMRPLAALAPGYLMQLQMASMKAPKPD